MELPQFISIINETIQQININDDIDFEARPLTLIYTKYTTLEFIQKLKISKNVINNAETIDDVHQLIATNMLHMVDVTRSNTTYIICLEKEKY